MALYNVIHYHFSGDIVVDLSTTIKTLHLENPTILASGIMDEDAGSMKRVLRSGAAAVVTKSIGLTSRTGHANPSFVELGCGILNAMGLPNPGISEYQKEIKEIKRDHATVIGSIFGSTIEEFKQLAKDMQHAGVDALELNVSCPHAKGFGLEIGQDPNLVEKITASVKKSVLIPVFVKLSSNVNDIVQIAKAAEKGNADGLVAINTVKAMAINIDIAKPILANKIGGYSGRAIKPIGIRSVFDIYEHTSVPIIGVGGVTDGNDAIEYIMAGASAVQIGTGVYSRGIDVFKTICDEMGEWMKKHQYSSIEELRGVAH
jgi:dihydroorotate dehydrogenase (NAD+) catalytic subunit